MATHEEEDILTELDYIKSSLDQGGLAELGSDAFFTDETIIEAHEAYVAGDNEALGLSVANYIDSCLRDRAIKHLDDHGKTTDELMRVTMAIDARVD